MMPIPSLNKVVFTPPLFTEHLHPQTHSIDMMHMPILDQIEISIWKSLYHADSSLPTFREHFGEPQLTNDRTTLHWHGLGISMSAREKWAYRVIRLPATETTLAAISPLLKLFPRRPNGKPAAQLRSGEIAWNFLISHDYDAAESALLTLAILVIPANKRAKLRVMSSDNLQECRDGATNGLVTFYLKSLCKLPDKEEPSLTILAPSKTSTWRGKIYCKRLSPAEPWGVRFEATLLGQKLEKSIGKMLPADLTLLPRRLSGLCFDDFWRFERFDWPAFMEAACRSADYKRIPFAQLEDKARFLSRSAARYHALDGTMYVTMWQKQIAKKVARILGSKPLGNKIGAGEFSNNLQFINVLPKADLS